MTGAVELGEGARQTLSVDGRGQVVAVYRRAAYVRLPAGLVALTSADVWRGPLHVRCGVRPDRLAPGDRVDVAGGAWLRIGRMTVDLSTAAVWRRALPDADSLAGAFLPPAPPSALVEPPYARRLAVAVACLERGDLGRAARALGGLGPGLTPAGDDAMAGILLVRRARRGPAAEPGLVRVAAGVRTTSVSREMLAWAARGQSVEPVHDLLAALAAGDQAGANAAMAALVAIGHTSGADLAFGLRLGLGLAAEPEPVAGLSPARASVPAPAANR